MEYIIFLTYRCNLKCSYCFASNVVSDEKNTYCLSSSNIEKTIDFIKRDVAKQKSKNNSIVFFGGEPTLVPDTIDDIINKTKELNLKYSIYTNGLLLNKIPTNVLSKLDTILVAIDGDKVAHETYKPIGSYEKILENVRCLKSRFHGELIARITMEENTNIFESVTNLLNDFDFVHWQIVNKPYFTNSYALIESYEENIDRLCDFWVDALKHGIIHNIIPFNEIMTYVLSGIDEKRESFWCGCGRDLMSIDLYGNVYQCDEYINKAHSSIGTIHSTNIDLKYDTHTDLFENCKKCKISAICLGRCKKALESLSEEQLNTYCQLTHILIDKLLSKAGTVKSIIKENKWDSDCFPHSTYKTEIIP